MKLRHWRYCSLLFPALAVAHSTASASLTVSVRVVHSTPPTVTQADGKPATPAMIAAAVPNYDLSKIEHSTDPAPASSQPVVVTVTY